MCGGLMLTSLGAGLFWPRVGTEARLAATRATGSITWRSFMREVLGRSRREQSLGRPSPGPPGTGFDNRIVLPGGTLDSKTACRPQVFRPGHLSTLPAGMMYNRHGINPQAGACLPVYRSRAARY